MVAISQAPSPESNPNSPLPVIAMVGHYPTIKLIGQKLERFIASECYAILIGQKFERFGASECYAIRAVIMIHHRIRPKSKLVLKSNNYNPSTKLDLCTSINSRITSDILVILIIV